MQERAATISSSRHLHKEAVQAHIAKVACAVAPDAYGPAVAAPPAGQGGRTRGRRIAARRHRGTHSYHAGTQLLQLMRRQWWCGSEGVPCVAPLLAGEFCALGEKVRAPPCLSFVVPKQAFTSSTLLYWLNTSFTHVVVESTELPITKGAPKRHALVVRS